MKKLLLLTTLLASPALCAETAEESTISPILASLNELQSNTTLTSLDLRSGSIGATGVQQIKKDLESNTTITVLNLLDYKIGDASTQD